MTFVSSDLICKDLDKRILISIEEDDNALNIVSIATDAYGKKALETILHANVPTK